MSISNSAIAFYGIAWVWGTSMEPGPLTEIDEQDCTARDPSDDAKDCRDVLREHDVSAGKYGNSFTGDLSTYLYIPESRVSTESAQPIKTGGQTDNWIKRIEDVMSELGIEDQTLTPGWYVAAEIS